MTVSGYSFYPFWGAMNKKHELTVQQQVQALLGYFRQQDLAVLVDVSQATISRIKRGDADGVDYQTVDAIRKLYKRYRSALNKPVNAG